MILFSIKLRKRIFFLVAIVFVIVIGFVSVSIYQWGKLADEEYFYNDIEKLYERLTYFPSNLNIENVKRIKASINPSHFKFVVMGDNRGHHTTFNKAIKGALSHNPDFIIHLGDLTKEGKIRHYQKELDFIREKIPVPFILVIGNHDYYNNGFISYTHIFGPLDFYFDIGKYRFICIDNNFIEKVEKFVYLPDSDMEWEAEPGIDDDKMRVLKPFLQKETHINLIFMHQPPPLAEWERHAFTQNGKIFIDLIKRFSSKVPYVCASHIHGFDEKKLGETKFIVSGGLGAEPNYNIPGITTTYNYVLFEVDKTGIKNKVYFIN